MLYLARDRFSDRMLTLSNYEADNSAMARIVVAQAALEVARDHPFGVGLGAANFVAASKPYMPRTRRASWSTTRIWRCWCIPESSRR